MNTSDAAHSSSSPAPAASGSPARAASGSPAAGSSASPATGPYGTLTVAAVPIGRPGDASPLLAQALAEASLVAAEDTRRLRAAGRHPRRRGDRPGHLVLERG